MTRQRDPDWDPIEEKTKSRRNFADLFPSGIVEKVSRQIDLLEAMFQHKFLRERIILGGASHAVAPLVSIGNCSPFHGSIPIETACLSVWSVPRARVRSLALEN